MSTKSISSAPQIAKRRVQAPPVEKATAKAETTEPTRQVVTAEAQRKSRHATSVASDAARKHVESEIGRADNSGSGAPTGGIKGGLSAASDVGTKFGVARPSTYRAAEAGSADQQGNPRHSLQDFLDGKAPYVSVALSEAEFKSGAVAYGDRFRIPELEEKYGRPIEFRAVDSTPQNAGAPEAGKALSIFVGDDARAGDISPADDVTLMKVAPSGHEELAQRVSDVLEMVEQFGAGAPKAKQALDREFGNAKKAYGAAAGGAPRSQVAGFFGGDMSFVELIMALLMAIESGDPDAIRAAVDKLETALTQRARSSLSGNAGAQQAVDDMATPTGPVVPGQNGTASFDSVSRAGARNQMVAGRITVNGNTYNFRSGGHGRGSLPPGNYQITRHMQNRGDRSMNVGGVGYSFAVSDKYDPRVGGTRSLLRIHPDGGSAGTMGCIGIVGDAATQARFRADMNAEIARNGGSYTLRVG